MYAPSECVRIFLCLAAQEKSLGASVAEGGGRWDMINFCPIEKKTLNGAKKLSLGHGSKIDSVLFCSRVPAGLHRKKMPGVRQSHAIIKSKLNFLACDSCTPYNLWRAMLKKYFLRM